MSKGSQARIGDVRAYKDNFEAIFGKKNRPAPPMSEVSATDRHMVLVERFRVSGGSAEHAAYKQAVRDSFEAALNNSRVEEQPWA